jgi:hypothetical protein
MDKKGIEKRKQVARLQMISFALAKKAGIINFNEVIKSLKIKYNLLQGPTGSN